MQSKRSGYPAQSGEQGAGGRAQSGGVGGAWAPERVRPAPEARGVPRRARGPGARAAEVAATGRGVFWGARLRSAGVRSVSAQPPRGSGEGRGCACSAVAVGERLVRGRTFALGQAISLSEVADTQETLPTAYSPPPGAPQPTSHRSLEGPLATSQVFADCKQPVVPAGNAQALRGAWLCLAHVGTCCPEVRQAPSLQGARLGGEWEAPVLICCLPRLPMLFLLTKYCTNRHH